MKDVIISITGTQTVESGDDVIELVTDGKYSYGEKESLVTYDESSLTGMEGTKTTFKIEKGIVTLTREGAVNSQMLFQKGRKHFFLYDTPFGATTMGVDTQKLRTDMGEHGGKMDIIYSVDVDNIILGRNIFSINVKEVQHEPPC
jgi:uncharacterized beta-barrel protein YwiB (DUF1934 family)